MSDLVQSLYAGMWVVERSTIIVMSSNKVFGELLEWLGNVEILRVRASHPMYLGKKSIINGSLTSYNKYIYLYIVLCMKVVYVKGKN